MAKNKPEKTPHYELLYIVSNKYTEEELKPIIEEVKKIITKNEGQITYDKEWGKRKLAYPIKHFSYGYYNLVEFDIAGEKVAKIDQALRLSEHILRHQIVAKKFKTAEEIAKEEKEREEINQRIAAKKETEQKEEKEIKEEKQKSKKSIDLKELDKKLDKILETDDLL